MFYCKALFNLTKEPWYILLLIIAAVGVSSCSKKEEPQKWEYKTIEVWGENYGNFHRLAQPIPKADLDTLGAQGWELVNAYTLTETVHPNFGNEKYVTGIKPNTRTAAVCYVFKRPKMENTEKNSEEDTEVEVEVAVPETTEEVI